jgi:hypothetical protein
MYSRICTNVFVGFALCRSFELNIDGTYELFL